MSSNNTKTNKSAPKTASRKPRKTRTKKSVQAEKVPANTPKSVKVMVVEKKSYANEATVNFGDVFIQALLKAIENFEGDFSDPKNYGALRELAYSYLNVTVDATVSPKDSQYKQAAKSGTKAPKEGAKADGDKPKRTMKVADEAVRCVCRKNKPFDRCTKKGQPHTVYVGKMVTEPKNGDQNNHYTFDKKKGFAKKELNFCAMHLKKVIANSNSSEELLAEYNEKKDSNKRVSSGNSVQCKGVKPSDNKRCKRKTNSANGYCNSHSDQAGTSNTKEGAKNTAIKKSDRKERENVIVENVSGSDTDDNLPEEDSDEEETNTKNEEPENDDDEDESNDEAEQEVNDDEDESNEEAEQEVNDDEYESNEEDEQEVNDLVPKEEKVNEDKSGDESEEELNLDEVSDDDEREF